MDQQAYNQGWHDGYQTAHDEYQEHEARIYATAFHSGLTKGINTATWGRTNSDAQ